MDSLISYLNEKKKEEEEKKNKTKKKQSFLVHYDTVSCFDYKHHNWEQPNAIQ